MGIWLGLEAELEMIMAVEMVMVIALEMGVVLILMSTLFVATRLLKKYSSELSLSVCSYVTLFVFLEQYKIGFEQRKVLCVMPSTFLFQGP